MTIKERVLALLGFTPSDLNTIIGECLDAGLDEEDDYDIADRVAVITVAIKVMELILTTADTKNENTYGITYDRIAVLQRIKLLKGEIGLTDGATPLIKNASFQW